MPIYYVTVETRLAYEQSIRVLADNADDAKQRASQVAERGALEMGEDWHRTWDYIDTEASEACEVTA